MSQNRTHVELTAENFASQVLESPRPVLVDFYADWCGPCRKLSPVLEELAADFAGRATVAKANIDRAPDLAARYGIRSIPALLFFKDGELVDQLLGAQPRSVLAAKLESLGPAAAA